MTVVRNFRQQQESPQTGNVPAQGAITFSRKITTREERSGGGSGGGGPEPEYPIEPPKNINPSGIILLSQVPNLGYAWEINQIQCPVVIVTEILGSTPEKGYTLPAPQLQVIGYVGSQIAFQNLSQSDQTVEIGGGSTFVDTFNLNISPFIPYSLPGGQQIKLEFIIPAYTPVAAHSFEQELYVGYVANLFGTEFGAIGILPSIKSPGVLTYHYI